MQKSRSTEIAGLRAAVLCAFVGLTIAGFVTPRERWIVYGSGVEPAPTPRTRTRRPLAPKYLQFPHDIKGHTIACSSCHKFPTENWNTVRAGNAAFPDVTDYPKHESCLDCHRQQFFRGSTPAICSICHTAPSPRNSNRHPFPNPREIFDASAKGRNAVSDFAVNFPHDKHIDIVTKLGRRKEELKRVSWSNGARAEESCAVCHSTYQPQGDSADEFVLKPPEKWGDAFWLKKGTLKKSPISHVQCFTCHTADSGLSPAPDNCAACHQIKQIEIKTDFDPKVAAMMNDLDKITLALWRKRDSSATFRHEWFSHAELSCSTCHNVAAMNTADAVTKKVPVSSCSSCHATATVDEGGALNYEIGARRSNPAFACVKCHIAYGKLPVPASHIRSLTGASK